ncbi:DUF3152 domain-containing protein [Cellulomonas sp. CW35]|uniref:DUF3152 domain-containing protein n=1 Tax=Cellulomonas sp. CW35 TaxID=3458249 RepID=UPI004034D8A8
MRRARARAATVVVGALLAGAGTGWVVAGPPTTSAAEPVARPPAATLDALDVAVRGGGAAARGAAGDRPLVGPSRPAGPGPTSPGVPSTANTPAASPDPTLPPGLTAEDVAAGLLAADVPEHASGELVVVPAAQRARADAAGGTDRVLRVRVEVEKGLPVDPAVFADFVMTTLTDGRGWGGDGSVAFEVTDAEPDVRVVLASPDLVDEMCAPLRTAGQVSCGRNGHAALNFRRWVEAVQDYGDDRTSYRQYLVNHEVGHLLGRPHRPCTAAGAVADVMQQQSYAVKPCLPNAWPFPRD